MQIANDKVLDELIEIKTQLAEIATNQRNFQSIIANHENRLCAIEQQDRHTAKNKDDDFKTELLKLLAKCLLIGLTAICSLAGAGGLLAKIWVA